MPRSKKGGSAPRRSGGSSKARPATAATRLQTVGLFLTLVALAALIGSIAWGVWDAYGRKSPPAAPAAAPTSPAAAPRVGERVKVEVLNAGGVPGVARRATDVLRERGFDVVSMGNAPRGTNPNVSVVYDRVGKLQTAQEVGGALAIPRVETRRDPAPLVDVTVILGRDWKAP